MKIFLVDKYNELGKHLRKLEKLDIVSVEKKDDCKFKMTKNDFAIITDNNEFEGIEKLKNIIVLTKKSEKNHIWNMINRYKVIDVIDFKMPVEYACERIERLVKK